METRREQELIWRVVDREDDTGTWSELRDLVGSDRQLWERLADGLEEDMLVRRSVGSVCEPIARSVSLSSPHPTASASGTPARPPRPRAHPAARPRRAWSGVLGWLAAALLGAVWLGSSLAAPAGRGVGPGESFGGTRSDHGAEFLGEMPRVVLGAEPTANGDGLEVVYVRRIVERALVDDVRALHADETGDTWSDSVRPVVLTSPRTY